LPSAIKSKAAIGTPPLRRAVGKVFERRKMLSNPGRARPPSRTAEPDARETITYMSETHG
jgi:hypothetical protein